MLPRTPARRRLKRTLPVWALAVVLVSCVGLPSQAGLSVADAGSTTTPAASQFHGFANALTRFAFFRRETRLPVSVVVSISDVNHSWAEVSWVSHFAAGQHKRIILTEEFVAGTYHRFGTGYATAQCPNQMPVQVCTGGFTSRDVTVR